MTERVSCAAGIDLEEGEVPEDTRPDEEGLRNDAETLEAGEDLHCADLWIEFTRGFF